LDRTLTDHGIRWDVIREDLRTVTRRIVARLRHDKTAWLLIFANLYPVVDMIWKGEPVASLLVIYWIQLMIIGFWNAAKLVVICRWKAIFIVPMFLVMYLSIINIFGIVAGSLLDDQMRGTIWHEHFSLWNYWVPAALFFASHGLSFWVNFIGGREFESTKWDQQMGKPILRAMPMWLAALAGGILGGSLGSAAWAVLFVLPVKLALDVFGHFADHGLLNLDDAET